MHAPFVPSQPYCALSIGARTYVLTQAEWHAALKGDQARCIGLDYGGQTYWLTQDQYREALKRGKAYQRTARARSRIARITYGDTVQVSLENGETWQGTPAAYTKWYTQHARGMLALYRERQHMEADIQDPEVPVSVIAADATARIAGAMPDTINPADFKDQVYLIVHEAMSGIVAEAKSKLALLTPPPAPTREGRVTAISPQGYVVTLLVQEETSARLIETITAMQGWLEAQQYTPPPAAVPF